MSYQLIPIDPSQLKLNPNLPLLDLQPLLVAAIESWREWSDAGLAEYFPSRFPTINRSQELPMFTDIDNLATMLQSINGTKSLRNIAIDHQQSLLNFTKNILPLLRSGVINLCLFSQSQLDRPKEIATERLITSEIARQPIDKQQLIIACIDDSVSIYQNLELFLTQQGYRSYCVQDPLKIMNFSVNQLPIRISLGCWKNIWEVVNSEW